MAREPEPLERVRALVCEFCWANCFDTEAFEKLGRGDIDEFKYDITGENLQAGTKTGCTWCSLIGQVSSGPEIPSKTCEITLIHTPEDVITPTGSNFYRFRFTRKLEWFHCFEELEFFTECDNFAAQQVTAREVDGDMTPSKTSPQIARWLKECEQHTCCPEQIDFPLPTRVIEVETAKICHTNGASGRFVALSYCWGSGSQTQLRLDTIETLMQHLDVNELPQTIKDAILVTRSLSIPYLWVDALCIIQDDAEDKAREIGSMAKIYSNAYITIVASSASDAAHGFLAHRDEINALNARIPFRTAPNRFGSIIARQHAERSSIVGHVNPLSTRAWALQEQMMASRILAYTKRTLEWRCASSMMSLNDSLNVDLWYDPVPKLISQLSTDPEEALLEWTRIVADYSCRSISLQSDKLPAIAALAERFAAVLGHYYAGLWRYDLIKQLCWIARISQEQRPGNAYRAPSWSWASVDGVFVGYGDKDKDCCNLVSAVVLPKNAQVPYGEVVHASLKIRGKVAIASITRDTKNGSPRCTLVSYESEVAESPLQRFYKTYFHRDTKSAGPSRGSAFKPAFHWDCDEFGSDPLIALLLPLRQRWYSVGKDRRRICEGLVLIPAGPGIVRRIGMFSGLNKHEIEDLVEQEITIV